MRADSSLVLQERTIDLLLGALEVEPFIADVLLGQIADELADYLDRRGTLGGTAAMKKVNALRAKLTELVRCGAGADDFDRRVTALRSAFRSLVYVDGAHPTAA